MDIEYDTAVKIDQDIVRVSESVGNNISNSCNMDIAGDDDIVNINERETGKGEAGPVDDNNESDGHVIDLTGDSNGN